MSERSTIHGGGAFPETHWALVCDLASSRAERGRGLERLAALYWQPICLYLRQAVRVEREESKDLTQAFFAWLVDAPVLERYDPGQGTFRAYLKGVLRNYVRNERTRQRAQKRGGGRAFAALGDLGLDDLPDPAATDPEQAFDLAWVQGLIARATERVRAQLRAEGEGAQLAAFEAYDMAPPGAQPTYASVAEDLGQTARAVRHALTKTRERVRAEVRAELRDTVRTPDQLDGEWRALFGA